MVIDEIFTGRMRPRHVRFKRALERLCVSIGQPYRASHATLADRLAMQVAMRWNGSRLIETARSDTLSVLHQGLSRGAAPYIAEFDVPLAIHGYDITRHRRANRAARAIMERSQLRALLVFSDWAGRAFDLHFGPTVGSKCQTVYPLAFEQATCGSFESRHFDFCFISTRFRIKSGPEVVRAFTRVRGGRGCSLCVVTNLAEARRYLGDLAQYPGVEWREATLDETAIAQLLAHSRCLVHPSLSDSFGVVVLEALAAGCAVITSDMASFPELVDPSNGYLLRIPTGTVVGDTYITEYGAADYHEQYLDTLSLHRFEDSIEKCLDDFMADLPSAQARMQASIARYSARFSWDAWQARMRNVLSEAFPEIRRG